MNDYPSVEYAIKIADLGYVKETLPVLTLTDVPTPLHNQEGRKDVIRAVKELYVRVGCPEIAEDVQLISRSVTVTFGEWEPAKGTS